MAAKLSPEMVLAKALAVPYSLPGKGREKGPGTPLSYRMLPDGGMVVIAAAGRKLWFSTEEVEAVRNTLDGQTTRKELDDVSRARRVPVKLVPPPAEPVRVNNGKAVYIALSKDQFKDL
jgi:hypothetical protein